MKDKIFAGKRILFVGPVFYNYHIHICETLTKMGAEVVFVPEHRYANLWILCYKNLRMRTALQKRYFKEITANFLNRSYDYLFVIRGADMPQEFVSLFRDKNPAAKCIMYQWDSEKANPYIHLRDLFDWIMTFDVKDAETYHLKLLHLFYHDGYRKIADSRQGKEYEYDFIYTSSFKKERYEALIDLEKRLQGFRFYHFIYQPLRSYVIQRLSGYPIRRELISFTPMAEQEMLNLLSRTRCVIDVTPSIQTGMPIRILEALGAHVPILTTNEFAQNFLGKKSFIQKLSDTTDFGKFLQTCHTDSFDGVENFSIDEWLYNIFTNTGSNEICI